MKRLISLSGLGLVKGGAVSGAENRRALRNNDKEISLDYKRPQMNACNNKKRSHTQLDSRKQVIAFQDRVITINVKEAQHPQK